MFTLSFWKDAIERAIKTFAQALVAVLAVGVPIWDAAWLDSLGVALMAAAVSLLTSMASTVTGDSESASLVPTPGRHRAED